MATRSLGTLTLDLIAKIGGFTQGMDQASRVADKRMRDIERRANAFGRTIGSSLRSAGAQFLAFAGVSLSVGAAFEKIKGSIDLADETRDLSIRLGVSTEALSAMRYQAQQTGTDMDTLSKGMKILAKNAADALNPTSAQAKVFQALGVSVTDSAGNLKSLDTLIPQIADKFALLEDGTTKAALAQALFGKSGLELTEFLNSGSQGLKNYADRARELGIVISQDTANAADKFNDDLSDLKSATDGLALQVAQALLPELDKLVNWATEFASDGKNAEAAAHGIASGFDAIAASIKALAQVVGVLQKIQQFLASSDQFAQSLLGGKGVNQIGTYLKTQFPSLYKPIIGGSKPQQTSSFTGNGLFTIPGLSGQSFSATSGTFNATAGTGTQRNGSAYERGLANALSNPTAAHARSGKSDAERQADQTARAIEQMTKAQQGWEAEVSKTGNPIADEYADRLRQVTEQAEGFAKDGVPADKVKAFTDEMTKLATSIRDSDLLKFQKEFDDQTAEMAAQMQGPAAEALQQYKEDVAKLDEELKAGLITLDEYNARVGVLGQQKDSAATGVLKDLQSEIALLGATNEQRDIYNRLAYAGVDANSALGQAIVAQTHQLHEQQDAVQSQVEAMDALRGASRTFLDDLEHGKGVWAALKDAVDSFADALTQLIEKNLVKQALGEDGSTSGGSGWGAAISSFFGSMFGGGRAGGGSVSPGKLYEVGEYDRPEMLMSGGKQYMIPGNRGSVVPLGGSSSGAITQNFYVQGSVTSRTATQIRQESQLLQNRATSRNR